MSELVPVRMRDCRCPGSPHPEGDFAYLKPKADPRVGLAAYTAIQEATDELTLKVELGRAYAIFGIARWDVQDDDGKPVPINPATVDAVDWGDIYPVVDKASELYSEDVLRPLVARVSASSRNGRTKGSTSRTKRPSSQRRKR